MRTLAAVHAATDYTSRVLDRDTALRSFDIHDAGDNGGGDGQGGDEEEDAHLALAHELRRGAERARQTSDDSGHDDERDAVADSAFGNLLADPHQEHRARGERYDGHHDKTDAGIVNDTAAAGRRRFFERDREHRALEQREHHGAVAGVLGDLAAARLAFFVELVEIGRRNFQQVEDDGDGDVRHDAERED